MTKPKRCILLSFLIRKAPYWSSGLSESMKSISCLSFLHPHPVSGPVMCDQLPSCSLAAVARTRTSCGRQPLLEQFRCFWFVMPALISKSCLILTSDLFLISSFCIRQTTGVRLAVAAHLGMKF